MAKILCIGVGNMGYPMAMNMLKAGHELAVFDTSPAKVDAMVAQGARAAADMADGVKGADFIFTSLPGCAVMETVLAGPDGVAAHLSPGQIVMDTSTVSVSASRRCSDAIEAKGGAFLRCPVNGSIAFAETAKLTVIVSGPEDAYQKALPVLECISQTRFYLGEGDKARLMKLAVNLMVGITVEMIAEAAVLCEKGGIDWDTALDVFAGSSVASPQLLFKLPAYRNRDFTPNSFVRTMVKDFHLGLEAAGEAGAFIPVSAAASQVFDACMARGNSEKDFAAVLETIEAMSGL